MYLGTPTFSFFLGKKITNNISHKGTLIVIDKDK